jgi:hypothetical protein
VGAKFDRIRRPGAVKHLQPPVAVTRRDTGLPLSLRVINDLTMNIDNFTDKTKQSIAAAIQLAKDYSNVQGDWFPSLFDHGIQYTLQSIQHTLRLFSSTKVKLPVLDQELLHPFLRR